MLDPRYEVGHKLLNGAFVLDGARDTLCDLHLIPLTAWRARRLSQAARSPGKPTPALKGTSRGDITQKNTQSSQSLGYSIKKHGFQIKWPGTVPDLLLVPYASVSRTITWRLGTILGSLRHVWTL